MSETGPQPELMRALSRLVRGLALLFWGLPLTLVVSVQTARTHLLAPLGMLPPILANAILLYGLFQIGQFQRQEAVWRHALDRLKLLALVNLGLAPFLYWWKILPHVAHYRLAVAVLALSGLLFVVNLNLALQRLAAMLPDETLRLETRMFTTMNLYLLLATLLVVTFWTLLGNWQPLPPWLVPSLRFLERTGLVFLLLLLLLPIALTMTLLWKIKEVVLASVFAPGTRS
jgi:hypothetical protein